MNDEFNKIKQKLIPYYREWDKLGDVDEDSSSLPEPDKPATEIIEQLLKFVEQNPNYELGIEELLKVQLLTGEKEKGIATLRKLIDLPANRSPKKMHQLKTQLNNLINKSNTP
jgi:hypothetical protein